MAQATVLSPPVGGRAEPVIKRGAERSPSRHRLGPRHVPLEAKRCRHGAIAIPEVAVRDLVAVATSKQRTQPP